MAVTCEDENRMLTGVRGRRWRVQDPEVGEHRASDAMPRQPEPERPQWLGNATKDGQRG